MDMYTLLCLKRATNKGLPYNTGGSALLRGGLGGRGMWRRIDARARVAESLHSSPEALTTAFSHSTVN